MDTAGAVFEVVTRDSDSGEESGRSALVDLVKELSAAVGQYPEQPVLEAGSALYTSHLENATEFYLQPGREDSWQLVN